MAAGPVEVRKTDAARLQQADLGDGLALDLGIADAAPDEIGHEAAQGRTEGHTLRHKRRQLFGRQDWRAVDQHHMAADA
jgi:hypothetical protein